MMTYEQAAAHFTGRNALKDVVRLRYAETLEAGNRMPDGHHEFYNVQRHGHTVVRIWDNGSYQLFDAGWPTVTTKKTLNTYGPVQVYQEHFQWYIPVTVTARRQRAASKLASVPFRDGMLVNDLGQVYVNPETWDIVKLRKDS